LLIFEDTANPSSAFGAIMTCSQADEACPIVPGAEGRFVVPYEDPKIADHTPEETPRYAERCAEIASEMFYVFSNINKNENDF
jgi:arsenate reductase